MIAIRRNIQNSFVSLLSRGVPNLSNEAASLYRIGLGFALLYAFQRRLTPIDNSDLVTIPPGYGLGSFAHIHWLSVNLWAQQYLVQIAKFAMWLFILGVLPSLSFTVATLCALQIVGVQLTRAGQHVWGAPMVVLLGLCFAAWGDRYSLAGLFHRQREPRNEAATRNSHGFAVWWPSLVLGVAYLCAAIAKLRLSGVEWITGGAVKYHFVEDFQGAPVDWGLRIAAYPALAVLLSLAGVVAEGTFILVNLISRPWIRFAFGLAGLGLHFGFWLFQGVVWIPWLVLYVCFLPWESIHAVFASGARRLLRRIDAVDLSPSRLPQATGLRPAHWIPVMMLFAVQSYACYHRYEFEPFFSDFPMYSNTSQSWDDFVRERLWSRLQRYHFEGIPAGGETVDVTSTMDGFGERTKNVLVDTFRDHARGTAEVDPTRINRIHEIRDALAQKTGKQIREIRLRVDRRVLDLDHGTMDWQILDVPVGSMDLDTGDIQQLNTAFLNDVGGIMR